MYHGADHSSHLLAKVGGFFLLPAAAGLASKLAAPAAEGLAPKANPTTVAAVVGTVLYGGLAYGLYHMSENDSYSESMQSLFRGGMWGAGISAALCAATPAISKPGPTVVSGSNPKMDKIFNLLTANAAVQVAQKRAQKALPAR